MTSKEFFYVVRDLGLDPDTIGGNLKTTLKAPGKTIYRVIKGFSRSGLVVSYTTVYENGNWSGDIARIDLGSVEFVRVMGDGYGVALLDCDGMCLEEI